ncbi:MAG: 6,7-dimethyl-8-ribityllumazine synthase [Candidatus Sumerlaeia bacterium]|nr:6,7-dimethyl-8-ribityllumazine synthase [Candidatus Sumerlaeia bacterium]
MPQEIAAGLSASGLRFAIVLSRFNSFITDQLLAGALDCLTRHGAKDSQITVVRVPGSFEIPLTASTLARRKRHDAIIALGAVIKGATSHDELIAAEATKGLTQVMIETGIPVAHGILTPSSLEQAIERAGTKMGNKGWDAALGAIEMANLMKELRS